MSDQQQFTTGEEILRATKQLAVEARQTRIGFEQKTSAELFAMNREAEALLTAMEETDKDVDEINKQTIVAIDDEIIESLMDEEE